MNLASFNLDRRLQFSTADAHPWPVSPNPWMKITVAVCLEAAGNTKGGSRRMELIAGAEPEPELNWNTCMKMEVAITSRVITSTGLDKNTHGTIR